MNALTDADRLAAFAVRASYDDLSARARRELKIRILDALGCAVGAIGAEPVRIVRQQVAEFDHDGRCSLIGGGRAAPDRATFYNGALVRYLDYNDSYLARGETCHPSDNLAPVLAAAEFADASGRDLMAALAVAYQVQCRLSDVAPVRARGFDHTTQGSYAVAAGAARALGLDAAAAANAVAISGTAFNALRVTRTGTLSHWKGLAYPNAAAGCVRATFLARRGLTGPREVFEGEKGFMDAIAGPFDIDWAREDLERVTCTIIKRHNAEIHAQTAIDAALALRKELDPRRDQVERVDVDTFDVAHEIIGAERADRAAALTKEQADHSLQYLIAVAILDGEVLPRQFSAERIRRPDVQALLRRVTVRTERTFSQRFPDEMLALVRITMRDGRTFAHETTTYPGLGAPPLTWDDVRHKFEQLTGDRIARATRDAIVGAVRDLEQIRVSDLTPLLTALSQAPPSKEHQHAVCH